MSLLNWCFVGSYFVLCLFETFLKYMFSFREPSVILCRSMFSFDFCILCFYLQETDQEKLVEVKPPRRGRSSRTSEEAEKDQPQGPEKPEETLSHGERRSGAAAKEAAAGRIVT